MTGMKKSRFSEEQIIGFLKEEEVGMLINAMRPKSVNQSVWNAADFS